ncbi:pisatin demethylase [Chaetomium sp. MPI-CAGE-AT-0009]|nr:pisatin demethylase [Chaetomium sp. MPI-CAGE-AT-0009]
MLDQILDAVSIMLSEEHRLELGLFLSSLLVATFVVQRLRRWYRLRHIPGPPLAGFSRWFWLVPTARSGQLPERMRQVESKYGRLARVGPNTLLTSDWELWRRIMAVRSPYVRSKRFKGFRMDPARDHVLSVTDDKEHHRLRTIMVHGYSGKEVEGVEEKMDSDMLSLIDLLESRYIAHNKAFDFGRKAQYLTTDVVAHLTLGKPMGFLANDTDMYNYIDIIEKQLPVMGMLLNFPEYISIVNLPFLNRLFPKAGDKHGMGRLMGIAKEAVAERFGPNKKAQRDMLGSFVARGLTQEEIESELVLQFLAGSDTTATVLRSAMLLISTNPRILRTLQAEIDATPPYPQGGIIPDESARALPYLTAVIRETLRWLPPGLDLATKVVPPEGDVWGGVVLPAGTEIGWNAVGLMRVPEVWGEDSGQFRPERWLEVERGSQRGKDMEVLVDLVFAGGSRYQCLGKAVAMMEIRKALFELFRRFEFEVMKPDRPWVFRCWNVIEQHEFWLKAHPRESASMA